MKTNAISFRATYAAEKPRCKRRVAALEQDPNMGDLVTYKVFLCDLFGGHEDVAVKELNAFNQIGSNASYYFANATWSLYHQKTEDARGWLRSAGNIYAPTSSVFTPPV